MSCADEGTVHIVQYGGLIDIGKICIIDGPRSRDLEEILVDRVERLLLNEPNETNTDVEIHVSKRGLRIVGADGEVLERFALHKIAHIVAYHSDCGLGEIHRSIILIHANEAYQCCMIHSREPDEITKICDQLKTLFNSVRSEIIHSRRVMMKHDVA